MTPDDYFELGYIIKPHGLKGAMHIELDVDDPWKYEKMESVFVRKGDNLIPFFIKSLQITGARGIIELDDIKSIEDAQALKSCSLFLPANLLPPLNEDQFYYHEVIGYTVVDIQSGALGIIEEIYSAGIQDLISMKYKDKEVLLPVSDEIVLRADHDKKEVYVNLPQGLLDVYL